MEIENTYISYMDILGFSSRIRNEDFIKKYKALINVIENFKDKEASFYLLSDSIIIFSQKFEKVKNHTQSIYKWGILNDFWIRGAIARGNVENIDTKEVVKMNGNIILPYLGQAYLTAYGLESKLNLAGIAIDSELLDNPNVLLSLNIDYIEYEEYLYKEGNEGEKRLLLPCANYEKQIVDSMYFEEMFKSHLADIDKYINTFSFYIMLLVKNVDDFSFDSFLEELLKQLGLHGRRILIPSKIVIIFIAVIDGLFKRYRSPNNKYYSSSLLELNISTIIHELKKEGYLSTFTNYILEYDKKRHTSLYKDIYEVRSNLSNFA